MIITLIITIFCHPPISCVAYLSEVLEIVLLSFKNKNTTVAYKHVAYKKTTKVVILYETMYSLFNED